MLAPFALNSKLLPALQAGAAAAAERAGKASKGAGSYIVNVSAMEGQFYRKHKTAMHPHTNMAKAALNMMTRTSAAQYARLTPPVFMNSVDTGWVNDEAPVQQARANDARGFRPPLDDLDAAMRVLDPVLSAVNSGEAVFGAFLKDYRPCPW